MPICLFAQRGVNSNEKLLLACKKQNHDEIIQLIKDGADVNYIKHSDPPLSPLLVSSLMGDSLGVSLLLKNKAQVNILNNAPLASACMFGYPSVVESLINSGASGEGEAIEAFHMLVLKTPRDLKWLFLNEIATEEEIGNVSIPDIQTPDDYFQYSFSVDDKPYLNCIDLLIKSKFSTNSVDDEGFTALDKAIEMRSIPYIQKLIGLNFTSKVYSFETIDLSILAASQNNVKELKKSLDGKPLLLNQRSSDGKYLISESFKFKCKNTIDLLLSKSPDIMVIDGEGNSLLHYAAIWGEPNYSDILLPALKNHVDHKNNKGISALYEAALIGRKDLFHKMQRYGKLSDPAFSLLLHDLLDIKNESKSPEISNDELDIINFLNQKNIFLNGYRDNQSAIEKCVTNLSAHGNNVKLISLLVEKSGNIGELNELIPYFVDKFDNDFIQMLVLKGVDLSKIMEFSVKKSNSFLVNWLLALQKNIPERNLIYKESLHTAVLHKKLEIAKDLIESGISPNNKNANNFTPLDYAILGNDFQFTRLLIDAGANLDLSVINKETLSHLKSNNNPNMQKIFGIMILKNQVIVDNKDFLINCARRNEVSKELEVFNRNISLNLPNQRIEIDQRPRFWDWFPYTSIDNNEKFNRFGYIIHGQKSLSANSKDAQEYTKKTNFYTTISDLGTLPVFDFGQWGSTSKPKELTTVLKLNNVIPFCEWNPDAPLSYPAVEIFNNAYYSNQPLVVEQKNKERKIILPGKLEKFDRSEGEIKIVNEVSSIDKINIDFNIQYNIGPATLIPEKTSLDSRLQTYSNLNEARQKINSGELSSTELQSMKTYVYVLSLLALEKRYDIVAENELNTVIDELNNTEAKISKLYNVLFSENNLQAKQKILDLVNLIIKDGHFASVEVAAFQKFENDVNSALNERELNIIISEFLKKEIFVDVENKIFNMQLLMLEIAQYVCISDLNKKVDYAKNNFINKSVVNPAKFFISPSDVDGKGNQIIKVFKN